MIPYLLPGLIIASLILYFYKRNQYVPIILAVMVLLTLGLRLFSLGDPHLLEYDTVYGHRITEEIIETGKVQTPEKIRYWPAEWNDKELTPLYAYALAGACKLNPVCDPKTASKWNGPLFAILAIVAMSYLGYAAHKDWLLGSLFLAFSPGILFRSVAGYTDKDTAALFFMILGLYFVYRAIKESSFKVALMQSAFGGLTMGLGALSASVYVLYIIPIALYGIFQVFRGRIDKRILVLLPFIFLPFVVASTAPRFADAFTATQNLVVLAAGALLATIYLVHRYNPLKSHSSLEKNATALGIVIGIGIIFSLAIGHNLGEVSSTVFYLITSPVRGTGIHPSSVGEQQPSALYWNFFDRNFYLGANSYWSQLLLVFPASLLIFWIAYRTKKDEDILTAFIYGFNFWAASTAIRLFFTLVPPACLAVGRVFTYAIHDSKPKSLWRVAGALGVFVIFFSPLPQFSPGGIFITMNAQAPSIHTSVNWEWFEDFKWINQNTQPLSPVVTWWDYGYWIQYFSRRPSIADGANTGPGAQHDIELGLFFTETNETLARGWMDSWQGRLVTLDATMLGKMYWASRIGGRPTQYSVFNFAGEQQSPYGPARVYSGGSVAIAQVSINGSVVPLLLYTGGGQQVVENLITYNGVEKVKTNLTTEFVPGGVYFAGNAAIYVPPESVENTFTKLFIQNAGSSSIFAMVFDNLFTKTFYLR